ncbi:hypothetical protein OPQ81_002127 [Rhizoctonia solani]|nr:hypothetical protein OPQ81_002127 [Rhizoctonia solani]
MLSARISRLYVTSWLLYFWLSPTSECRTLSTVQRQSTSTPFKAGLGWGGGGNISQFEGHKVGWYFTWSTQSWVVPPPTQLEFVPQLWGERDAQLFSNVFNTTSITANGWENVLGMNEPQLADQANMSATDGVNFWKKYLEPLKSAGIRLGSPATTSGPSGKAWMQEFFTLCAGTCTVDFVALHWYGNVADELIAYLEDFHNTFQRPIWVTEYSCQNFVSGAQCTYEEIVQFLNVTQTYMDQTPWVERYAWFGAMASMPNNVNHLTALMDPSGIINQLGRQYIGSPATPSPTYVSSLAPTSTATITGVPITSDTFITSSSTGTVSISSQQGTSASLTATPAATTPPYIIINGAITNNFDELAVFIFVTMLSNLLWFW